MKKTIGVFEIDIWEGGYPAWCHLRFGDKEFKFTHSQLSDLKFAVDEMIKASKRTLPKRYHNEI